MNLLKLNIFIFPNLYNKFGYRGCATNTNITNWKKPISLQEKKNVIEMMKRLVEVKEKISETLGLDENTTPIGTADEIAK